MTSIVFMGTPKFSAPILEGLIREGYDVKAVVTQPDRYVGRKHVLTASPVKETAARYGIEVLQPEKISGSAEMDRIIELKPDLIVTAAFGQFLPNKLIEAAKVAAINVHGSLLPKYRGGAPVQYAIMNGDSETGVTIIYMVKKMDAGAMLAQAKMPIEENDDTATVFQKMSILGRDTLLETIPKILDGTIKPIAQNEERVVFSPSPGAYLADFLGKRMKLWNISVLDEKTAFASGTVVEAGKHVLKMAAADGTVYMINELQPAGKPKMKATDYLNGIGKGLEVGQKVIV